eukprot:363736-Chlamydomonas_euryale.AAC.17
MHKVAGYSTVRHFTSQPPTSACTNKAPTLQPVPETMSWRCMSLHGIVSRNLRSAQICRDCMPAHHATAALQGLPPLAPGHEGFVSLQRCGGCGMGKISAQAGSRRFPPLGGVPGL